MTPEEMIKFLNERADENVNNAKKWEPGTWLNGYYTGRASSYEYAVKLITETQLELPVAESEPEEPEHIEGKCDKCGDEVDEDANICPRCIRNYALNDAMDRKRDEQIERELEGKR